MLKWRVKMRNDAVPDAWIRCCVEDCKADSSTGACPGVCTVLGSCGACAVHGRGGARRPMTGEACAWCVKEAQCQKESGMWEGGCGGVGGGRHSGDGGGTGKRAM